MRPNKARFWNVRLMPISTIRCGGILRVLRPHGDESRHASTPRMKRMRSAMSFRTHLHLHDLTNLDLEEQHDARTAHNLISSLPSCS
jgi:hypothetical protein